MTQSPKDPKLRDLVPFEAGGRLFAVFASHVDGTAEGKIPAAIPRAPKAVLGLVCVRGRMLTVLDPLSLFTGEGEMWPESLPTVIALRGDEQLALAAWNCRGTITVADADIQRETTEDGNSSGLAVGLVRHGGEEITVINTEQLFGSAMSRRERRRRRF